MNIWALADLHLSFGTLNKSMEVFGPQWKGWTDRIYETCSSLIQKSDLLLIAGDISWASTVQEVQPDLKWIDSLPGTKVILKGNHDYWWPSKSKLSQILPPSIHFIQHDTFLWNDVAIGGSRLWDTPEYQFHSIINLQGPLTPPLDPTSLKQQQDNDEAIFQRELARLKMSLESMPKGASIKIAMTHYPPIGLDLKPSRASLLMDNYNIDYCVFGHLHNLNTREKLFGKQNKTTYVLTSCDYLDFSPIKIL